MHPQGACLQRRYLQGDSLRERTHTRVVTTPTRRITLGRWTAERWAASSGIAFAIILIVSNFLAGTPPHYNASASKIAAFMHDHHSALVVQGILGGVLIVLFL